MLNELRCRCRDWIVSIGRVTRRGCVGFPAGQAIAPLAPRHAHDACYFAVVEGLQEHVMSAHTQDLCPETIIGMATHHKFQRWILEVRNMLEDVLPRPVWQVAFA